MLQSNKDLNISKQLIDWYKDNKRELPWRNTNDPYLIWVSEIILQQTRVNQGMDYFLRFTERFPDVKSLANAQEEEVLKYWQGLGYYSRARNLHAAAKSIVDKFNGFFPQNYQDILSLKGVGEYTAAAIGSFAWNMPYPVVDGNVFRVLSRLFGISEPIDSGKGKKLFNELAVQVMDSEKAGIHNQAIMEFGALHCTPFNPQCLFCPLVDKCMAYTTGKVTQYPVKQQKIKNRNRYFHYFHIVYNNAYTYLHRRGKKDIWQGLFEFPLIETETPMDFLELKETKPFQTLFNGITDLAVSATLMNKKHVLSHQTLYTNFYKIEIDTEGNGLSGYLKVPVGEIEKYAIPRLIHIYLEKMS
ncbi:A/G-specific adenine glycosylase [Parabacteroides pacaensis]|uniref:A/G-specific adenine glycosylase n=1 Tax=Parabacteroides pacaensis TaxID=2086575 RepID=UPI000D0FC254|nr:A/G-specific adenine glycosylase [Parabacteroides pacaensis]